MQVCQLLATQLPANVHPGAPIKQLLLLLLFVSRHEHNPQPALLRLVCLLLCVGRNLLVHGSKVAAKAKYTEIAAPLQHTGCIACAALLQLPTLCSCNTRQNLCGHVPSLKSQSRV